MISLRAKCAGHCSIPLLDAPAWATSVSRGCVKVPSNVAGQNLIMSCQSLVSNSAVRHTCHTSWCQLATTAENGATAHRIAAPALDRVAEHALTTPRIMTMRCIFAALLLTPWTVVWAPLALLACSSLPELLAPGASGPLSSILPSAAGPSATYHLRSKIKHLTQGG